MEKNLGLNDESSLKFFNGASAQDAIDTTYVAKSNEVFNQEYLNSGYYNNYDVDGNALKDAEEILSKFNVISFEGDCEVNKKSILSEIFKRLTKKAIIPVLVALGIVAGTTAFVDVANHPENYLTTHPDFEGSPTISQIIERTPENFGIGGR